MMHTRQTAVSVKVAAHDEFKASSLTASWKRCDFTPGRLPAEWAEAYLADNHAVRDNDGSIYIVRSYGTPIAWYIPGTGWTMPQARYSQTTTRHQRIVEAGLVGEVRVAL